MSAELIAQDAIAHIERLEIKDGDVLIMRLRHQYSDAALQGISETLRTWLNKCDLPSVQVLLLEDDVEVSALSPAQMREHGWARIDSSQPD